MTMKKIRLDNYDLGAVVNCLYNTRGSYPTEKRNEIDDLLLSLIDTHEQMKPGRRKRIPFQPEEVRLIYLCMNDWRNSFLSAGEDIKAEVVAEIMIKFIA